MNERHDLDSENPAGNGANAGPPTDLDVLIGRIVDGEASPAQRQHFESLANVDPAMWRRLALRQQDMAMLAVHVEPTLNAAEKIELPVAAAGGAAGIAADAPTDPTAAPLLLGAAKGPWWMAVSGWAALIALATAWGAGLLPAGPRNIDSASRSQPNVQTVNLPPEELLSEYMQAPYVMGEMPSTLLNIDELSDGRLAVSYLRRIVEVQYYNSAAEIPLDENGLSSSPRELRRLGPKSQPAPQPHD